MKFDRIGDSIVVGREELIALAAELKYSDCADLLVFISGGAARDQMHNLAPKDIDIALVQASQSDLDRCGDVLEELGWVLTKKFDDDKHNSYSVDLWDAVADRLIEIRQYVRIKGNGAPVERLDLLSYHHSFESVQDVMDSHDHTVNQFAAWWDPVVKTVDARYFGKPGNFGTCFQLRDDLTAKRIERVRQICADLGWTYAGDM